MVRRKDGGDYAAAATLYQENVEEILSKESLSGPMYVGESEVPIFSWGLSTGFQNREFDWEDNFLKQ